MKLRKILLQILFLALCPGLQNLVAGTHVWSGAQDGIWSHSANWSSGGAPTSFEAVPVVIQFPSSGVTQRKTTNNIGNLTIDVLAFYGANYELYSDGPTITLSGSQPPFPYAANIVSGGAATNFMDDSFSLTLATNVSVQVGNNATLFLDGQMDGSGGITKKGLGTLVFSGCCANSYTGTTAVTEGVLKLSKYWVDWVGYYGVMSVPGPLVVGDPDGTQNARVILTYGGQLSLATDLTIHPAGTVEIYEDSSVNTITLAGGHLAFMPVGWYDYDLGIWRTNYANLDCHTNFTASPGRFGNPTVTGQGSLTFTSVTNTEPSTINITAGALQFEPSISGFTPLHKIGDGEFNLLGEDSHVGDLIVERGVFALSTSFPIYQSDHSLVVSNGAQLSIRTDAYLNMEIHLNGFGVGATNGALVVEHDAVVLNSFLHLDSDTAIVVTNGSDTVSLYKSYVNTGTALISGPGSLTKKGPGTLQFTGNQTNGMTAPLIVDQGTLTLNLTQGLAAVSSPLIVGHTPANGTSAEVRFLRDNQLFTSVPITIKSSGLLNVYGTYQTAGPITLQGGNIGTSTGTLVLNGDLLATNGAGSIISGNLFLGATKRSFHLAPGYGVNIQAQISDNGPGVGFDLDGGGSLTLSGSNTFSGPIHVKEGLLYARHDRALGKSTGGTFIDSGARLAVDGRNLGTEPIVLAGDGGGYGALSCSKTNVLSGLVSLSADASINVAGAADRLTLFSSVNGSGGLTKLGAGTLLLTGAAANTYTGPTTVAEGSLELNKSGVVAIPGALVIGDDLSPSLSHTVRVLAASQFIGNAALLLNASGVLDINGAFNAPQSFGSLAGSGSIQLGFNTLSVGSDNRDTQFTGPIAGFGASSLVKQGSGTWTLGGNSLQFVGSTFVNAGKLRMMGWNPSSPVTVNSGGTLAGDGLVADIITAGGVVSPGCCPMLMHLSSKNLSLNLASSFRVQLDGTNGPGYFASSQLAVAGAVNLGGATLAVTLGFSSSVSNRFVIIDNDGNDPVTGIFKGLPEGATFGVGAALFQITYHGGDGNDVVLTHIGVTQPPKLGSISALPNGSIQISATGAPGLVYNVEATTNLTPPAQWTALGSATANPKGQVQFTDPAAPNFPIRFYRFVLP